MTLPVRRSGLRLLVALLAPLMALGVAVVVPAPVSAAPSPGGEGGTKALRDALEAAAKAHIDAQVQLEKSKREQDRLTAELRTIESRLVALRGQVAEVAAEAYRRGRLTPVAVLLDSHSPEGFLQRAAGLELIAQRDDQRLRALAEARAQADQAKAAIDATVVDQKKQLAIQARKKKDAEKALAAVGGGASGGLVSSGSPLAKPAPRAPDGSWPPEQCSINDPTTGGCITPRTLHAMNQAKAAGYTRYVSCFRSGGDGEHPKGRACDFSAAAGGFKNESATGGDRTYGNTVAAFFVKNADRLGVLYVIWYRQIWMPNTGWRAYSGAGSPAADHTNHVHLSMY